MPGKVLIVDDDAAVLHSTALMIRALGYEAITLDDASRVHETAEREHPDVIIQDLRMKDLNVAGLVAGLRSNEATADIPIVFFSAAEDIAETTARFDAWGYLRKPFTQAELGRILEHVSKEPAGRAWNLRQARRDVDSFFHTHWNLIAALNNYAGLLQREGAVRDEDQKLLQGINDMILRLEANTDRLRGYLGTLLATSDREATAQEG